MKVKRERYLIFVRHAHRDTLISQMDNGLSEKGKSQVGSLKLYFKKRWLDQGLSDFKFFTSPKLRCQETLNPVASLVQKEALIEPLLNELSEGETHQDLVGRVVRLMDAFSRDDKSWVCCSHGDWIPEFFQLTEGSPIQLKKSGVVVLKTQAGGRLKLVEMITQWKAFGSFKFN
jgi:broad specificity phosphatase PhoE